MLGVTVPSGVQIGVLLLCADTKKLLVNYLTPILIFIFKNILLLLLMVWLFLYTCSSCIYIPILGRTLLFIIIHSNIDHLLLTSRHKFSNLKTHLKTYYFLSFLEKSFCIPFSPMLHSLSVNNFKYCNSVQVFCATSSFSFIFNSCLLFNSFKLNTFKQLM